MTAQFCLPGDGGDGGDGEGGDGGDGGGDGGGGGLPWAEIQPSSHDPPSCVLFFKWQEALRY